MIYSSRFFCRNSLFISGVFVGGIAALSCGNDKLPQVYEVGGPRILGLRLSIPRPTPGVTVTVTPLIAFVNRTSEAVSHQAELCVDPGVSFGNPAQCDPASPGYVQVLPPTTVDFSASELQGGAGAVPNFSASIPAIPNSELDYLLTYTLTVEGQTYTAYVQIPFHDGSLNNTNPSILSIQSNDDVILNFPSSEISLKVLATDPENDELIHTWLTRGSKLSQSRTVGESTLTLTPQPEQLSEGQSPILIVITRDENGGLDWKKILP